MDRLTCGLFVIILITPLIVWFVNNDENISATEKRELLQQPSIISFNHLINAYPNQFERYFNDQFGWRDQLVYYHNLLKLRLFDISPNIWVIAGLDGWFFFNDHGSYQDYLPSYLLDELHLERYVQILIDRSDWLESMGSHYLVLPIPNKVDVYTEYLPARIGQYKKTGQYDQLVRKLKKNGQFELFVDVKASLMEAKQSHQVYFKSDTHWNEIGVAAVYAQMAKRLAKWFPKIKPLNVSSTNEGEKYSGDLVHMLNLQQSIYETKSSVQWKPQCNVKVEKQYNLIERLDDYQNMPKPYYPTTGGCAKGENKALVIHDSFGEYLRPLLSQHFETVIYSPYIEFNELIPLIELEKPDVVIDMRVARNFKSLLQSNSELKLKIMHSNGIPKKRVKTLDL